MFNVLIQALGRTLIHSLWQAGVIFVVLKLVLGFLKDSPARLRYLLAYVAMAGIFLCFFTTFYHQWESGEALRAAQAVLPAVPTETAFEINNISIKSLILSPGRWLPYLVVLYGMGLIFFSLKMLRELLVMKRLQRSGKYRFDPVWEKYLQQLAHDWNISKKVKLYLSDKIDVPVIIGYFKPVIYLPFSVAANLPPQQIEAVLLHELAHIKRYDFVANAFQTAIETLLFFNPFIWLIAHLIEIEREKACDEWVVSLREPKIYAESLLALTENREESSRLVLAAKSKKQLLFLRIKNIMEKRTQKTNPLQKWGVLLLMSAAILLVSWLAPSEKKPLTPEPQQATSIDAYPSFMIDTARPQSENHARTAMDTADTGTPFPKAPDRPPTPPDPPAPPTPSAPPAPPLSSTLSQQIKDSIPNLTIVMDSLGIAMDSLGNDLQQYFNSEEWKRYKRDLKEHTLKLKQYFNSDEWKMQKDSLRHRLALIKPTLEAALNKARKQLAFTFSQDTLKIKESTVDIDRFIKNLKNDGSLKENAKIKIRKNGEDDDSSSVDRAN